jgi:uncharacterized membrane protein
MSLFIVGLILFFATHSISIVAGPWRDRMVAQLGEKGWQGIYSLISIIGFVLIVLGYGVARGTTGVLYTPPLWTYHITALFMLPVFTLLMAANMPGRIKTMTRHPMLLATILWALGHLISNGAVADVLLFGVFLVWSIADRISVARRAPRMGHQMPPGRMNDAIAVIGGLAIYAVFVFWAHAWLFGVSPIVPSS